MSKRHRLAMLVNLFVPGAGMIVLRREWLGLSLSVCFTLFTQMAVMGLAVVPHDVPRWLTWSCALGAVLIWAASQVLSFRRVRLLGSPIYQNEVHELCRRCREAMQRGNWSDAFDLLQVALRLDDEHLEAAQLRAQILAKIGRTRLAAVWNKRARRLASGPRPAAATDPIQQDSAGQAQGRLIE
jgi:hypothetical protein